MIENEQEALDDQLTEAVQKAVDDYYSACGELSGSWVLSSEAIHPESKRTYKFTSPNNQGSLESVKMATYGAKVADLILEYFIMNDEDD